MSESAARELSAASAAALAGAELAPSAAGSGAPRARITASRVAASWAR
jgi:hypothetical protein